MISTFKKAGIRTSLFVDTQRINIEQAALVGTDRIELYTEPYASAFNRNAPEAVEPFVIAAVLHVIQDWVLMQGMI